MALPPEVLITTMRAHQKYFALADGGRRACSALRLVANIERQGRRRAIVAGNERVLRARLADAGSSGTRTARTRLEERLAEL